MGNMFPEISWSQSELDTACRLVGLIRENNLGRRIAVYFSDEVSAVYEKNSFGEWMFVSPLDRDSLLSLAQKRLIDMGYDSRMELDIITLREEIFLAIKGDHK